MRGILKLAALATALLVRGLALGAQTTDLDGQVMGSEEDRVLWIFPNYRTVEDKKSLPHITRRDKLTIAIKDTFDPYAFPVAGLFAGVAQLENQYPSWGHGADGYGKRYLSALADQTVSNMMSEAAFPIMLHQDPRYFRLGRGGILHRASYAATRIFVTRNDLDGAQFNYSEFGGNAVMATAGCLYYPRENRNVGNVAVRFGSQLIFDMLADVGKEFWPDVKRWLVGK